MENFNQDEYLDMLNLEDNFTKTPSVWEVSKSFPDCREIAIRVAHDLNKEFKNIDEELSSNKVMLEWVKSCDRYRRLQELKKYLSMTSCSIGKKELNVNSARTVPIASLFDFDRKKSYRNRIQVSCPFHEDNTPSMVIYTETNSYHCYSCGNGGDVINFIMRLNAIKFVDAVNYLNGGSNEQF